MSQPICEGATAADPLQRFANAFNSLSVLPASDAEAKLILGVMQKEIAAVNQAIRDGKQPHEAYDSLGDTLSEEWNKITGGGSFVSALFPLGALSADCPRGMRSSMPNPGLLNWQ